MYEEHLFRDEQRSEGPRPRPAEAGAMAALRELLLGDSALPDELPSLPDLIAGVSALAEASRQRVTIPLSGMPAEFALSREADHVRIDCYRTESTPEILIRARRVRLGALLHGCAMAGLSAGQAADGTTMGGAMLRLSQRLTDIEIVPERARKAPIACTGGTLKSPGDGVALSFGFRAAIAPPTGQARGNHGFSDVHAMLFEGELWAFARTRRVVLARGPILLSAQRMTDAVRALLDAFQADRNMHVRLRAGDFAVALRLTGHAVDVELSGEDGTAVLRKLEVREVALPMLRLTSDMLRRLVSVDRAQAHNLRVASLRHEVRELRRIIRRRDRNDGFENRDPERLRLSSPDAGSDAEPDAGDQRAPARLRYTERWSAEIDGLDANAVFLCGEQIVVATPKLTLALDRNDGGVRWTEPSTNTTALMAGRVLLRLHETGELDLIDVGSGNVYARARIGARIGTPRSLFSGGHGLPPMAILTEGHRRLVAVDLRTGELRWRFRVRGDAGVQMHRAGRVLLVTSGDGSVDALDISTGEVVWRYCDKVRFCLAPTVVDEMVLVASGEPGGGAGGLFGIELFSGRLAWQTRLPAAPSAPPVASSQLAIVPFGGSRHARVAAVEPDSGEKRWVCQDPGLDHGGQALQVDDALIVNTPRGRVLALDLASGETRWSQALSNPLTDDVPRQLMPRLRQGALFTPSAQVHVLRPSDGTLLAPNFQCDLVPDFLQVDERGWLYIAEESGHLRAYGTAPHLSLVV